MGVAEIVERAREGLRAAKEAEDTAERARLGRVVSDVIGEGLVMLRLGNEADSYELAAALDEIAAEARELF